jgi:hypothetical protein
MKFQKGIGYPYPRPPRGPGRGDPRYSMSRAAYQARLRNLVGVKRPRTNSETRLIELEVALGTHRGESYRAIARRLGIRSYAHCWRVARKYRNRQIPMLPQDARGLLAMRASLASSPMQQQVLPWWMTREWSKRDEIWGCILFTQEQKAQAVAEFDRREYAGQAEPSHKPPNYVIPERYRDPVKWKEQYYADHPWLRRLRRVEAT